MLLNIEFVLKRSLGDRFSFIIIFFEHLPQGVLLMAMVCPQSLNYFSGNYDLSKLPVIFKPKEIFNCDDWLFLAGIIIVKLTSL